jgi:hypothetical protein
VLGWALWWDVFVRVLTSVVDLFWRWIAGAELHRHGYFVGVMFLLDNDENEQLQPQRIKEIK